MDQLLHEEFNSAAEVAAFVDSKPEIKLSALTGQPGAFTLFYHLGPTQDDERRLQLATRLGSLLTMPHHSRLAAGWPTAVACDPVVPFSRVVSALAPLKDFEGFDRSELRQWVVRHLARVGYRFIPSDESRERFNVRAELVEVRSDEEGGES